MSLFNNLNLSIKIFLFASLIAVVFLAGIVWLGNGYRHEIEKVAEKKLMAATDTAWGIIDFYSQQEQKGEFSTSEAQNLAKKAIKALRFENNTYFWINDTQPTMIMHPIKPELDGQDLSRTEDPDGLRLFVEMVNVTRDKPEGFVHYKWPKPGKEEPQSKLSYVKKHPSWQWIIGSGIYIDDLQANINQLYYMIATVCLAGLFITLSLIVLFSRSIARPLKESVHMLDEIEKGHYQIRLNLNRKDEIGLLGHAMDQLANNFETVLLPTLNRLAEGDITFKPVPRDDNDGTRLALKQVSDNLNRTIIRIQSSAKQIGNASGQVADASQSLSQGATESAASLEEISSSLSQLSSQTQLNAENATQVNQLSSEARQLADNGNDKMKTMVAAMTDISDSSQNISKIIKVIDEIAFQTNLLALNAAVEAARAGQHGKGFAVVAEEVRNLAARSAKAASETAELIAGSVQKTDNGAIIANQTAEALEEILGGVAKVSDLAEEIAAASNEQAQGIGQINQGLGQIDQVIQQNTATAEQSAATAEELSGQAQELVHLLSQFKLRAEFTEHEGITPRLKTDSSKILPPAPGQKSHRGETKNKTSEVTGSAWKDIASPTIKKNANKPVIALDDEEFGRY